MEIIFIVISIIVIIVTINICINVNLSYSLYKNLGNVEIKVFGITVFNAQISLVAGYFNLTRKNKKVVQIKIDFNDEKFKFIGDVGDYLSKKLFFYNILSNFKLYGTDPVKIALLSGNVLLFEGIIRSYISVKSPHTNVDSHLEVGYIDNYIKLNFKVDVLITIFDLVWAIVRASVKRSVYGEKSKLGRKC